MRLAGISLLSLLCALAGGYIWFDGVNDGVADTTLSIPLELDEGPDWLEPVRPLPLTTQLDPQKVALGQRLFHDTRLSRDATVSCASCHDLTAGGDDGRAVSAGVGGALGDVNAPTVFNSGFNFVQFWDGRAGTLEEQVNGPITHPREMGTDWPTVEMRLRGIPGYVADFERLYDDGVTARNIRDAIASFERSLVTADSRFDRYLNGDTFAITVEEREGYAFFKSFGCVSCHQGVNVGGNMFQKFGIMLADRDADEPENPSDLGRFNVTGRQEDRHVFKVPSLRNVELTAPYFHDGSAPDLPLAVRVMAEMQLGQQLTERQVSRIVAFLKTLTGSIPPTAQPPIPVAASQ